MRTLAAVLLALAALAFAAPGHATEQNAQRICPSILQPVCAKGSEGTRTFPNSCLAEDAGFEVVKQGSCEGGMGGRLAQTFCTREYLPVCGEKDGVQRTFANACEARAAKFRIIAESEC